MYNLTETSKNADIAGTGVELTTVNRDFLDAAWSSWSTCLRFLASWCACGAIKSFFFSAQIFYFVHVTAFFLRHRASYSKCFCRRYNIQTLATL